MLRKIKFSSLIQVMIVIIFLLFGSTLIYYSLDDYDTQIEVGKTEDFVTKIKKHYSKHVKANKDTIVYEFVDDLDNKVREKKEIAVLYANSLIDLENKRIDSNDDTYFQIKNTRYYVYYEDVDPSETIMYDSYNQYIPFDENVILSKDTDLYYQDQAIYKIKDNLSLPIIIIENDKYYVEYAGRLLSVLKNNSSVVEVVNNEEEVLASVKALNYNHFYKTDDATTCIEEDTCIEYDNLNTQLKYIKDNDYYTMTMKDLELWLDGKVRLPKKSVIITVDEGGLGINNYFIELLEKYDLNATLFLVTSWYDKADYQSTKLTIASNGDDIKVRDYCSKVSLGAKSLCLSRNDLKDDINHSKEKLGLDVIAFSYPYNVYSNSMINVLKTLGIKLAFIGGNKEITKNVDHYKIPRYVMYNDTLLESILN